MGHLLKQLFKTGHKQLFRHGEVIVRPGEEPKGVYYIEKGFVKVYTITKFGEENQLIIRKQDEIFPIIWGTDNKFRELFFEAMSDTTLLRLSKKDFLSAYGSSKETNQEVVAAVIEMFRLQTDRTNNLEMRSAKEKVAYRLIALSNRFGEKDSKKHIHIVAPIRHHDIADSLSISRETASREISKLEKAGILAYDHQTIVITDIIKLTKIIQGS